MSARAPAASLPAAATPSAPALTSATGAPPVSLSLSELSLFSDLPDISEFPSYRVNTSCAAAVSAAAAQSSSSSPAAAQSGLFSGLSSLFRF
jgi:hypothetical protein